MSEADAKLLNILEWLYTNDGNYGDKNEWRRALILKIKEILEVEIKAE